MNPLSFSRTLVSSLLALVLVSGFQASAADESAPLEVKISKNRPKSFGESPTILVPTVYVKLPIAGKVFVAKQGGALSVLGGGSANSVKAKAQYAVDGLDKKFAQQIAAKVQEDFVAQLRAAGFNVKTYEDLKDTDAMKNAKTEKQHEDWGMPVEKDPSGNVVFVVATPSDEQNFKSGLAGGIFNQFISRGKSTLGEGTIIIPTYTIAAPQAWGETGSGFNRISAKVNVAPGMNLSFAMASVLTEKGGWGDVRTKDQVINIAENVGELTDKDTTDHAGNAVSAALSALSGVGKISSKSGFYNLKINPEVYEAGVLRGAKLFNAEVAKVAAEVKK